MFWLGFIAGLFIGSLSGWFTASLFAAAKAEDERIERLCREQERFLVPEDNY